MSNKKNDWIGLLGLSLILSLQACTLNPSANYQYHGHWYIYEIDYNANGTIYYKMEIIHDTLAKIEDRAFTTRSGFY